MALDSGYWETDDGYMNNDQVVERRVAREILTLIEQIYFSEEYRQYRIDYGSNGTRDLILNMIESKYLRR
jgi:hypothetical protein